MDNLKYKLIREIKQYNEYCNVLEKLVAIGKESVQDEIDLLTLLIEKWDNEHNTFEDSDPIKILKSLMEEHDLKAKDLIKILNLSKGTISKILNYNKGLSKETIRKLSNHFKVSQEVFNRPYIMVNGLSKYSHKNRRKNFAEVE